MKILFVLYLGILIFLIFRIDEPQEGDVYHFSFSDSSYVEEKVIQIDLNKKALIYRTIYSPEKTIRDTFCEHLKMYRGWIQIRN